MSKNGQLKMALDNAREGFLLHQDGMLTYINKSAAQLLQVNPEKVLDKPLMLAIRHHRLEDMVQRQESGLLNYRGKSLDVICTANCLQMIDRTQELEQLETLEHSSHILAHEFRTPVAGISSLVEALGHGLDEQERQEVFELINTEIARLRQLVTDIPLGKKPTHERTFALSDLVPRLERFLAQELQQHHKTLEWRVGHTVKASSDAVYQVLLNLIDNAIRYSEGSRIVVRSTLQEQRCYLEVCSHGKVLQDHDQLFLSGRRGSHVATVRGTGLGLSVVRRLAQSWQGDAYGQTWMQNGQAVGNIFGTWFPQGESL